MMHPTYKDFYNHPWNTSKHLAQKGLGVCLENKLTCFLIASICAFILAILSPVLGGLSSHTLFSPFFVGTSFLLMSFVNLLVLNCANKEWQKKSEWGHQDRSKTETNRNSNHT